jgi:hypothetical protein
MTLPEHFVAEVIIELLKILPTAIIAGIVAYVAWQQWRTNKRTLDLALFDRRLRVWEGTFEITECVRKCRDSEIDICKDDIANIVKLTAPVNFLFDNEVRGLIDELIYKIHALPKSKDVAMYNEWMETKLGHLDKLFHQYMDFSKL